MSSPFRAIPAAIDLPAMERSILDFWRDNDIFYKSTESRAGGTPCTFYEGPPTANGMPGTHHIEARVFKDVFPRYQTMKGKYVTRKAGWDCHGLPVEIAVEKELGFSGNRSNRKNRSNRNDRYDRSNRSNGNDRSNRTKCNF